MGHKRFTSMLGPLSLSSFPASLAWIFGSGESKLLCCQKPSGETHPAKNGSLQSTASKKLSPANNHVRESRSGYPIPS